MQRYHVGDGGPDLGRCLSGFDVLDAEEYVRIDAITAQGEGIILARN
jgi:hypothetical protein